MVQLKSLVTTALGVQVALSRPQVGYDNGRELRVQYAGGKLGAVASESGICSSIGIELLRKGGNAADALVGTTLCVGTIGMYHSGIGGGGFMVVRSSSGEFEHIDFRESAPAGADENMFAHDEELSKFGGLASAVPSEVRGFEYLHKKYGSLPWRDVVMPAVQVARHGFPVSADLVRVMGVMDRYNKTFLTEDPSWALDFAPNGTRLGLGDTMTRRRLADTLETIANLGPDSFYTGPMAQAMVNAVAQHGGIMTMHDLAGYKVEIRDPISITYRNYTLTSAGAPSGGGVALSILKTLEGYEDVGNLERINLTTHRLVEAMRFAYAGRTMMGDPSFIPNMTEYEARMLQPDTARLIRAKISDAHTLNVSEYNPDGIETLTDHGTSHVVVADRSGLAISLTTTLNLLFGSQVMVPETGIIMNNEMNDFSIPGKNNAFGYRPSPSNYVKPGKRPLSSISPVIVEHAANKSLALVIGSAGGSHIITATVQGLWHRLDHGWDLFDSLNAPRLHDQLMPNALEMEREYDDATVAFMLERGHNVTRTAPTGSSMQALAVRWDGSFAAQGEPRQKASGGYVI